MKRNKKKTSRFINLAEQLTLQNEIVSSTMDSMLKFVSDETEVQDRSDFEQIKKTVDQINELNPVVEPLETGTNGLPRPKMNRIRTGQQQTEKLEG